MAINSTVKNLLCILLATSVVSISSCSKVEDEFPEVIFEESEPSQSVEVQETDPVTNYIENYHELSVALPYSEETIIRLTKLFYIEQKTLLPRTVTGRDISIDYLDSIDIPYVIHSVSIPDEGIGFDTMVQYRNTSSVPDIYLTHDIDPMVNSGFAQPIDNYLGSFQFENSGIYGNALLQNSIDGQTYGLPLYQSVMVIYGSSDYIPESGQLSWRTTTSQLRNYLHNINIEYDSEETNIIPFVGATQMIPYLTSAYNGDEATPYGCIGIDDKLPVLDAVTYVDNMYRNENSEDYNEDGSDPRIARNAGLWIGSSADAVRWSQYYPNSLYFSSIPTSANNSDMTPYASVYSVCLSDSCRDAEFAVKLISYICFDEDAQMLINRLEPKVGFLPVVKSSNVWDMVCSEELFGGQASLYRDYMDGAVYCPAPGSRVNTHVSEYCSNYENSRETEEEFEFSVEDMCP